LVNFATTFQIKKEFRTKSLLVELKSDLLDFFSQIEGKGVKPFDKDDLSKNEGIFEYGDFSVSFGAFEIENEYVSELYDAGFYKKIILSITEKYAGKLELVHCEFAGVRISDKGYTPFFFASDFDVFYKEIVEDEWNFTLDREQKAKLSRYMVDVLHIPIGEDVLWWGPEKEESTVGMDIYTFVTTMMGGK
jgi:hypothetical protein